MLIVPRADGFHLIGIVRAGGQLVAFSPRGTDLGAPMLTIEIGGTATVIMAAWATGAFVDGWTSTPGAVHERWQEPRRALPVLPLRHA